MNENVLSALHQAYDSLQQKHGAKHLKSIYGAGCIDRPRFMFVFMNPTGKNISSSPAWTGLRAPWLGTKNIWKLFYKLDLVSHNLFHTTQNLKSNEWTLVFSEKIYKTLSKKKIFITNLAKCTQVDARPLHNKIFQEYLHLIQQEILLTNPKHIITFGNQVSSLILQKPISVSRYKKKEKETLILEKKKYNVYPTYYPVGQGQRNLHLAIKRIKKIL